MKSPKVPLHPAHPESICWGCDKYCPADSLACGNGTIRTLHPCELFGEDWFEWFERDQVLRDVDAGELAHRDEGGHEDPEQQ